MDYIFDLCVNLLVWLASVTGTTYKEINVIIFCIIWPVYTVAVTALCIVLFLWARMWRRIASNYINK